LGLQVQVEAVRHVVRAHVVVRVNSFGGVPDAQGRGVQHEPGDMLTSGFTTQTRTSPGRLAAWNLDWALAGNVVHTPTSRPAP
jgi:hypothetical protein